MISVLSHQQLLSGSRFLRLLSLLILISSMRSQGINSLVSVGPEHPKNNFKIAVLLPFHNDINNSVIDDKRSQAILEYYQGMKIAIQEMDSLNASYEISFFDTDNDSNQLKQILAKPMLKKMDLIIGPTGKNQVSIVASFCLQNQIPVFLPMKSLFKERSFNPYVFNLRPSEKMKANRFLSYFKHQYPNRKLVLVRDKGYFDRTFGESLIQACNERNIPLRIINYATEIKWNTFINKPSLIFHTTQDKLKLNYSVTGLQAVKDSVILIGSDNLMEFNDVDFSQWESLSIQFVSSTKSHIPNIYLNKMKESYRKNYRDDPSMYALMGYDQLLFSAELLDAFGHSFAEFISDKRVNYAATDFNFIKTSTCYHNDYLYIYSLREGQLVIENK